MLDDLQYLSLSFPSIPVGENETPPNLTRFLYKGGASLQVGDADSAIRRGLLGPALLDRVELVQAIHASIAGMLVAGCSHASARERIYIVARFFKWAESAGATLNISEVQKTYLDWAAHLWHRVKVIKDLNVLTAYSYVKSAGRILDMVIGRVTPLSELTRLKRPSIRKSPQGIKADKQRLQETFEFGRLLQDICDGLSLDVIWGPRPVYLTLQGGRQIEVCALGQRPGPKDKRTATNLRQSAARNIAFESDRSLNNAIRRNLANLRVQAEMLMFIAQTGMNLAQTQVLTRGSFIYSSDIDGYKVREYKRRRHGEVLFEIYTEYRSHFERYLEWRSKLFPKHEQRLFPIIRRNGVRESRRPPFLSVIGACRNASVPWIPPRMLRGTRVNWLLRRTGDPDMAAEMAQHHVGTLLQHYEKPSLQIAVSEITRFHLRNDPALCSPGPLLAVAPGECNGNPVASSTKPKAVSDPDCRRPSGCLWCEHHRDIDSFDYVWSLASFRHLKILELSKHRPIKEEYTAAHPADHAIQRLSAKLYWFRDSNDTRREWIEEAFSRVEEGHYHDQWSHLIEAAEGVVS